MAAGKLPPRRRAAKEIEIRPEHLAMAEIQLIDREKIETPFKLPAFPPQVARAAKRATMALDGYLPPSDPNYTGTDAWNFGWAASLDRAVHEGLVFLGYPLLSEMAQRAEYRRIVEVKAEHLTRKWIKISSKGGDKGEPDAKPSNPNDAKDPRIIRATEGNSSATGKSSIAEDDAGNFGAPKRLPQMTLDPTDPAPKVAMMDPPSGEPDPEKAKAKKEKADKIKQLEDFLKSLHVTDIVRRAAEVEGFFGRAHIFLEFKNGTSDRLDELKKPVGDGSDDVAKGKCNQKNPLVGLRVIEPVWAYPGLINTTDPLGPNWYKPASWLVMTKEIHASRLLTVIARPVSDMLKPAYAFGGLPLTQMCKPTVDNWLKTRASVSTIISNFSVFVLKTAMTDSLDGTGDKLMRRVRLFNRLRDNAGTLVLDKENEDFTNVSAPISGLDKLQAQAQEHIAAVAAIPITVYLGQQPAGLNASSEGEIEIFYDTIHAEQESTWREPMTTIFNFAQLSLWGDIDEDLTFEFELLRSPDALEASQIAKTKIDADAELVNTGIISVPEARQRLANDPDSDYASLDLDITPPPPQPTELGFGAPPDPGHPPSGGKAPLPNASSGGTGPKPSDEPNGPAGFFAGHSANRIARDAYPKGFFALDEARGTVERAGWLVQRGLTYPMALAIAEDEEAWQLVVQDWEEAKHPREPAGKPEGGQFASKEGSGSSGSGKEGSGKGESAGEPEGQSTASAGRSQQHPSVRIRGSAPEAPATQLSWEAAPGRTTQNMQEFHDAPLDIRREYQDSMAKALTGPDGQDLVAEMMGLKGTSSFSGVGVYKGEVAPGAQTRVPGQAGDIDPETEKLINAEEAVRAMLLRQDAFAWHKPTFGEAGKKYLIPALRGPDGRVHVAGQKEDGATHRTALQSMSPEEQLDYIKTNQHEDDRNFVFINDKGQQLSRKQARQYAEENDLLRPGAFRQPNLIAEDLKPEASSRAIRLKPDETNLMDFRIGRKITEAEAQALASELGKVNEFYAPIATEQGWRILNIPDVTGIDNVAFRQKMVQAIEGMDHATLPDSVDMYPARAQSGYFENDWREHPNAEGYREAIRSAGPDVQRRADQTLAALGPKVAEVEDDFESRYGWKPDKASRVWQAGRQVASDEFREDLHPRLQKGAHGGGEFARKGETGNPTEAGGDVPAGSKGPASALYASHKPPKSFSEDDAIGIGQEIAKEIPGATERIEAARKMISQGVPTDAPTDKGGFRQADGTWTPERTALHQKLLREIFTPEAIARATPPPGQKPILTVFGGRGGSGKSWLSGKDGPVDASKTIVVDADEFKSRLPEYKGWNAGLLHEESSYLVDECARIAGALGINVTFDATLKSNKSIIGRIQQFGRLGYDVEGYYMYASPETATKRAIERFMKGGETGRFVPPEVVMANRDNEKNFDANRGLMKRWAVYDNDSEEFGPKLIASGGKDDEDQRRDRA